MINKQKNPQTITYMEKGPVLTQDHESEVKCDLRLCWCLLPPIYQVWIRQNGLGCIALA